MMPPTEVADEWRPVGPRPVAGALMQEVIDVLAVLNALRMALPPRRLTDYQG